MPNFSIPLSGLAAESTALSAIANNLSNQNTTGYKNTSVLFSDLFYQNLGTTGAGDPIQLGSGAQVQEMPANFTQGNVTSTGVPTDVAIQGNGFFTVQSDGVTSYTRAGDFSVDNNNFLVTAAGQQVLGYPAVNGVVKTGTAVGPLQLGAGTISPPTATSLTSITTNLNSGDPLGTQYSTPVQIFDSLGGAHTLNYTFTHTGPNTWSYSLSYSTWRPQHGWGGCADGHSGNRQPDLQWKWSSDRHRRRSRDSNLRGGKRRETEPFPGEAATSATVAQTITMTATSATQFTVVGSVSGALGTATVGTPFTSGQLDFTINPGSTAFAAGDTITVPTTAVGLANIKAIPITGFADGATNQTFNWNVLNGTTPVITQVAATDSTSSTTQDGSASGTLTGFSIGSDGTITGSFTNGNTAALGQLALASFADQQGLQSAGGTDYTQTLASGQAVIGVAGTGGRGTLAGGSLEASNVDISTEFANLIVAQRSFEADAKAVTTFDQVSQDTIALIPA